MVKATKHGLVALEDKAKQQTTKQFLYEWGLLYLFYKHELSNYCNPQEINLLNYNSKNPKFRFMTFEF